MAISTFQKAVATDEVKELIWAYEKARLDYESGMAYARSQGLEQGPDSNPRGIHTPAEYPFRVAVNKQLSPHLAPWARTFQVT